MAGQRDQHAFSFASKSDFGLTSSRSHSLLLYIHGPPDSATEWRVPGASLVTLSTPFALSSIWFPFGGLPNRAASLVPLSTPSFCRPNRGASLVPLSIPGPAWQILPLWNSGGKTRFSNGLPHNRTKVSGSWAEIDGSHINFLRFIFPFMSKKHGNG